MEGDKRLQELAEKLKFNHNAIADKILSEHKIIYTNGIFYEYKNGVYSCVPQEQISTYIINILKDKFSVKFRSEIMASIQAKIYHLPEELNIEGLLNLKNGLFDMNKKELLSHTPIIYSTIQLPVKFDNESQCPLWIKTMEEIFEGNKNKISILQEFFGLCLTRETKYCKALYMLGEGRNGKSTALYILENIVGERNRTAMSLEMLSNLNYVANLFGKLVNISVETNSKSEVNDATFKQITSGDPIDADRKYGHPFTFRPYCKLIYALNNMPRVNDKTDSYYDRLIILKFNRQFKGSDDNKNLKTELLKEIDGIFLWCLEGYWRLNARGYFDTSKEIEDEVQEYRKENNNVIIFVEEECEVSEWVSIAKDDLYKAYREWCVGAGHQPLSKIRFGKELVKRYKLVDDCKGHDRTRYWEGIDVKIGIPGHSNVGADRF